jgi:hypothetical protein
VSGLVNTYHEAGGALGVAAVSALAASSLMAPELDGGFIQALTGSAFVAIATVGIAAVLVPPGKPAADAPRFAH